MTDLRLASTASILHRKCKFRYCHGDRATPADMFWINRTTMNADPDGHLRMVAQKVGEFGPAKMPQQPAA